MFGVAGSSTLALPSMSVAGWFDAPESAESMAIEPACRWKSPLAGPTQRGSACRPWFSCPDAVVNAEREVYVFVPHVIITPLLDRLTRSLSNVVPLVDLLSTRMFPFVVVLERPLSTLM